jgi:asparagine synthase (glutamine-hydrolysing)
VSGIVGIFHRDGCPVDGALLQQLAESLPQTDPDGITAWTRGPFGFGQTALHAPAASFAGDHHSHSLHKHKLDIVGDVRLDAVDDLRARLSESGQECSPTTPPLELLLHAYAAWGPDCTQYLRGDFAFGIWDEDAETLFCARDHFGIKPFYFHDSAGLLVFSNTLNCVKLHPAVSGKLNELAVGDFLLFGLNYDKSTTTFRNIQRLPPGHWLLASTTSLRIHRYWEPPTEERIRYGRNEEYVERFWELLRWAVSDRLSIDTTGILLSGGLDSGAVATTAKAVSRPDNCRTSLRSYTVGYGSGGGERSYARKTAVYLGIPNDYVSLDVGLFEESPNVAHRLPEPVDDPLSAALFKQFAFISNDCRVALSGEGADNLMYFQMWPYLTELRRKKEWPRLLSEAARFLAIRPLPWMGAAQRLSAILRRATVGTELPKWIAPDFARRTGLLERLRDANRTDDSTTWHAVRPDAHASMLLPEWGRMFEMNDPGVTHSGVEVRYPFLDLRIVSFLLAIPPFPWSYQKTLIRRAMKDSLPLEVLQRAKTPLQRDPVLARLDTLGIAAVKGLNLGVKTWDFICREKVATFCDTMRVEDLRPYCLGVWLRGLGQR